MNRYKKQYIVEAIRKSLDFPDYVVKMNDADEVLEFFGFGRILTREEKADAAHEIRLLLEAESFKAQHRLEARV